MATVSFDAASGAKARRRRARSGNRWLVSGITTSAASGDTLATGMRAVLTCHARYGGAVGQAISVNVGASSPGNILVYPAASAALFIISICR